METIVVLWLEGVGKTIEEGNNPELGLLLCKWWDGSCDGT
jgi:hypothetical protein